MMNGSSYFGSPITLQYVPAGLSNDPFSSLEKSTPPCILGIGYVFQQKSNDVTEANMGTSYLPKMTMTKSPLRQFPHLHTDHNRNHYYLLLL